MRNPQVCRLAGVSYRYRYRSAVKRNGHWYRRKGSDTRWVRGRWSKRSLSVRHPTDPRYKKIGGKWVRRSAGSTKKYVRVRGLWWRSKKQRRFWWRARWNRPAWMEPANNPNYRRARSQRWVRRRRTGKFVLWEGIWLRSAKSKTGFWNRRWRPIAQIIANNPNMRRRGKGVWRNVSLRKPTRYVSKWGRWFRGPKSRQVFNNRRWVLYRKLKQNDPRYRLTRRGRWVRIIDRRGALKRLNHVFYHGAWISKKSYARIMKAKRDRATIAAGGITDDVRREIKAQVYANFSRFMKWFIRTYLRGGNSVKKSIRVVNGAVAARDRYIPQPRPGPGEPAKPGDSFGSKSRSDWLIDGKTTAQVMKNAKLKISADLGTRLGAAGASFLGTSSSSAEEGDMMGDDSSDHEDVEEDANTEDAEMDSASAVSGDPTLPASLNNYQKTSEVSTSDPTLSATEQ